MSNRYRKSVLQTHSDQAGLSTDVNANLILQDPLGAYHRYLSIYLEKRQAKVVQNKGRFWSIEKG